MSTSTDVVHQQAVRLAQERRLGDKLNPDRLASMIANKTPGEAAAILLAVGYVLGYSDGQSADTGQWPARREGRG